MSHIRHEGKIVIIRNSKVGPLNRKSCYFFDTEEVTVYNLIMSDA